MTKTPKKKQQRWGDGRVAFLARLPAIKEWLAAGRTLRSYYDANAEALAVTYSTVLRHARRHIPSFGRNGNGSSSQAPSPASGTAGTSPTSNKPAPIGGFRHNPEPGDKNELI